VARIRESDGREIIVISTAKPWGVETVNGVHKFEVSGVNSSRARVDRRTAASARDDPG
jgi:hypothetical protein